MPVSGGIRRASQHPLRGLLRDQEGAVGRVHHHLAYECGIRFGDAFAEDVAHSAVDVVDHQGRIPQIRLDGREQRVHRVRISSVAGVVGDVVLGREFSECGLVGRPRCDGDAHPVLAEEACAACADARAAADDQGDVRFGFG